MSVNLAGWSEENKGFEARHIWTEILILSLTSSVALGKSLHTTEP